jgi:magnesium-protoporphyrin O-methyltransferase
VAGCCPPPGYREFFNARLARRDARRYRRKGLDATAERMVGFLRDREVAGRTVLEIGGGVGAIQIELLKAGAARAANLELSPAYEDPAVELLRENGLETRAVRLLADVVAEPDAAEPADVVVMHRVVCCYPEPKLLVASAAGKARLWLVLSFPRERALTRLGARLVNLWLRLRRNDFRTYVHPVGTIAGTAVKAGFRPVLEQRGIVWQIAAFERVP